jgi:hypothetical protein
VHAHAQNFSRARQHDDKEKICKNFLCASTWNGPKIPAKFLDLLFFAVATKFFCRFFLYHHVGAHAKNFARARAPTPLKNCLNISGTVFLFNIFTQKKQLDNKSEKPSHKSSV